MSSFVGDKSKTVGVLPLKITVADQTRVAAFYVVESSVDYNILLGRDWIHQAGCIPSSLFQLLFFWDGRKVSIYPADEKPFEANAVQERIYDDDIGWVVLTGHDAKGAAAVSDLLERLLEYWAGESLQPNSPINLIEFLHETSGEDALTIDDLEIAPAEMEDDYPELLDPGLAAEIIGLLHEYKDCFAWDYHEMPGLPRSLVEHELKIKELSLFSSRRDGSRPKCN
ncbi:unnamed protein product [Prunus brigantina]